MIELWNGRDLIEFNPIGGGVYKYDDDDLSLVTTENGNCSDICHKALPYLLAVSIIAGILLDNPNLGAKYTFESDSGRLSSVSLRFDNDTITVDYLNQSYPSLLNHSNGKQLKLTYDDDKVIYIDLVAQDGRVLQSW